MAAGFRRWAKRNALAWLVVALPVGALFGAATTLLTPVAGIAGITTLVGVVVGFSIYARFVYGEWWL